MSKSILITSLMALIGVWAGTVEAKPISSFRAGELMAEYRGANTSSARRDAILNELRNAGRDQMANDLAKQFPLKPQQSLEEQLRKTEAEEFQLQEKIRLQKAEKERLEKEREIQKQKEAERNKKERERCEKERHEREEERLKKERLQEIKRKEEAERNKREQERIEKEQEDRACKLRVQQEEELRQTTERQLQESQGKARKDAELRERLEKERQQEEELYTTAELEAEAERLEEELYTTAELEAKVEHLEAEEARKLEKLERQEEELNKEELRKEKENQLLIESLNKQIDTANNLDEKLNTLNGLIRVFGDKEQDLKQIYEKQRDKLLNKEKQWTQQQLEDVVVDSMKPQEKIDALRQAAQDNKFHHIKPGIWRGDKEHLSETYRLLDEAYNTKIQELQKKETSSDQEKEEEKAAEINKNDQQLSERVAAKARAQKIAHMKVILTLMGTATNEARLVEVNKQIDKLNRFIKSQSDRIKPYYVNEASLMRKSFGNNLFFYNALVDERNRLLKLLPEKAQQGNPPLIVDEAALTEWMDLWTPPVIQ